MRYIDAIVFEVARLVCSTRLQLKLSLQCLDSGHDLVELGMQLKVLSLELAFEGLQLGLQRQCGRDHGDLDWSVPSRLMAVRQHMVRGKFTTFQVGGGESREARDAGRGRAASGVIHLCLVWACTVGGCRRQARARGRLFVVSPQCTVSRPMILLILLATLCIAELLPKYAVKYYGAGISPQLAQRYLAAFPPTIGEGHFRVLEAGAGAGVPAIDYLCHVPKVMTTNATEAETPFAAQDDLLTRAVEILNSALPANECIFSYGVNGEYWTFAYCFGDKVIQFHENLNHYIKTSVHKPENPDFVFVLGKFDGVVHDEIKIANQGPAEGTRLDAKEFIMSDDTINPFNLKNSHSTQKFLQHELQNGGICDWTQEPRTVDVIYKCNKRGSGKVQILDVNEIKTCEYQMIIDVPHLCQLEEFCESNVENEVTEIGCRRIDPHAPEGDMSVELFHRESWSSLLLVPEPPAPHQFFPIPNSHMISIAEYALFPLGLGFYLARPHKLPETTSDYYNNRHVIVYNFDFDTPADLINKLGSVLHNVLGRKLLAPIKGDDGLLHFLLWEDTFVLWFEVYDFYGRFIAMARIERDGANQERVLLILLVDPETMLDHEGDLVQIGAYEATGGAVNFERFAYGTIKEDMATVVTVVVTMTAAPQSVDATLTAQDKHATTAMDQPMQTVVYIPLDGGELEQEVAENLEEENADELRVHDEL